MTSQPQHIIFFGTADFAVPSLDALLKAGHNVLAVVTQPDKPQGRGQHLVPSPVKQAAEKHGLPLFQPRRVRSRAFQAKMQALAPDILAVAAFGQIIPQTLLDMPRLAPINVHGSLLPKYRGAAPIQRALMAGETQTGVATMWMDATLDTGDILLMETLPIQDEDTTGTLFPKLATLGARLLIETIEALLEESLKRTPQDHARTTLAPMITPQDQFILWTESPQQIAGRVRGLSPKPGAIAQIKGKTVKISMAKIGERQAEGVTAGTLLEIGKQGIWVAAGDGRAVLLTEAQPESGKRMSATDWARGARLQAGDRFDTPPNT